MQPDEIPDRIGRYEVIQHLASGGMADLFLCRQSGPMGFEKVVALKQIRNRHSDDGEFLTMFMDEARIAALLNHPNIAQIYELGSENGAPYLAMEFVNGRNLSAIVKKTVAQGLTVPPHIVAGIMVGILRGLSYAHTRKGLDGQALRLVHRDVTPQNVLVSNDGQIKLVDFGIAKASNQMARTRHGVIKGKYSYMSPEQVRSQPLDGRSDLFAVGILMYEALTAHRPFKRGNTVDTLKAVISELPPDPRRFNAALTKPMVDIIARALFKKRSKRFADAEQMLGALERFLHDHAEPVTPKVIARWVDALFEADIDRSDRTIVLKDIGELLLPEAESQSASVGSDAQSHSGIPERTVISMLSEVNPDVQDGMSGSISVQIDASHSSTLGDARQVLDHYSTVPHQRQFDATLDDMSEVDDRTQISDPPIMALLDPPSNEAAVPASQPPIPSLPPLESPSAGFRVSVDSSLPPRPGPAAANQSFVDQLSGDLAQNRLTLLKFIALGVGIGAVLLVGLIFLAS